MTSECVQLLLMATRTWCPRVSSWVLPTSFLVNIAGSTGPMGNHVRKYVPFFNLLSHVTYNCCSPLAYNALTWPQTIDRNKRTPITSLRPRRNRRYNADDIFKCIFLKENVWIPNKISLKFVPKGPINNIIALVQIMAWRRPGDKPLSESTMGSLLTQICVTRPQWVKDLIDVDWWPVRCFTKKVNLYSAEPPLKFSGDLEKHWLSSLLKYIDWLVQERHNCSALAMELRLSSINPSIQQFNFYAGSTSKWRCFKKVFALPGGHRINRFRFEVICFRFPTRLYGSGRAHRQG